MYRPVTVVEVRIWGQRVGAVALDPKLGYYAFEYDPKFVATGIELALRQFGSSLCALPCFLVVGVILVLHFVAVNC